MTANSKKSLSQNLEDLFSNIPKIDFSKGEAITDSSSLTEYYDSSEVFNQMLVNMDRIPPSWEIFMDTLKTKSFGNPVLTAVYEKLKDAPEELQQEVLYKFTHNKLKMLTAKIEEKNKAIILSVRKSRHIYEKEHKAYRKKIERRKNIKMSIFILIMLLIILGIIYLN